MNIELLRKVQDAILNNPWAFYMHSFLNKRSESPCGTAACIGGWAVVLANGASKPSEIVDKYWNLPVGTPASNLLGLDYRSSGRLFYTDEWPKEFEQAYEQAVDIPMDKGKPINHEAAALIAAARIEHFIATEGRE